MKKVYYISGLGANERAFERLGGIQYERVMIAWMSNESDESLSQYAQRVINHYDITKDDVIVGLSFGGLLAQQIGDLLGLPYVILISSFRTKTDLRSLFTNGLKFKLFKLLPTTKFPYISEVVAKYLNSGSEQSRPLLKEMIEQTDMKLMKWSIQKIYEQDIEIGSSTKKFNIIGTEDRIVKCWKNDFTSVIENGSHFMVYDQADEVTNIIEEIISTS